MPRQIRDLLLLLLLPPHSWPRLTVLRAVHGPDARGCSPREAGWLLCRIPPLGLAALWRRAYSAAAAVGLLPPCPLLRAALGESPRHPQFTAAAHAFLADAEQRQRQRGAIPLVRALVAHTHAEHMPLLLGALLAAPDTRNIVRDAVVQSLGPPSVEDRLFNALVAIDGRTLPDVGVCPIDLVCRWCRSDSTGSLPPLARQAASVFAARLGDACNTTGAHPTGVAARLPAAAAVESDLASGGQGLHQHSAGGVADALLQALGSFDDPDGLTADALTTNREGAAGGAGAAQAVAALSKGALAALLAKADARWPRRQFSAEWCLAVTLLAGVLLARAASGGGLAAFLAGDSTRGQAAAFVGAVAGTRLSPDCYVWLLAVRVCVEDMSLLPRLQRTARNRPVT